MLRRDIRNVVNINHKNSPRVLVASALTLADRGELVNSRGNFLCLSALRSHAMKYAYKPTAQQLPNDEQLLIEFVATSLFKVTAKYELCQITAQRLLTMKAERQKTPTAWSKLLERAVAWSKRRK